MKKYIIELNSQEMLSLKSFMERTELRGREVPGFISLINAINSSEENFNKQSGTDNPTSEKGCVTKKDKNRPVITSD
jgi:hypothetical protein